MKLWGISRQSQDYPRNNALFFIAKNPAQAKYFATLLLETENLTADDYCKAGHIEWCLNKQQNAVGHYKQCLQLLSNNWTQFNNLFLQDKNTLISNGIPESDIPLMLDGLKYEE